MKLYADGGICNGERILSEEFVRMATTVQNDSSTERAVNPPAEDNFVGYGFQIWMCRPRASTAPTAPWASSPSSSPTAT